MVSVGNGSIRMSKSGREFGFFRPQLTQGFCKSTLPNYAIQETDCRGAVDGRKRREVDVASLPPWVTLNPWIGRKRLR